ncbi:hypothetical protein SAMN04489710_11562 [Paracidovorax konjaci]|uniref:Uncharacterized protein n=1 Tax=Paracidovorax konjaci TaxID=32040 RepID=A0A1I1Y536_9BURK|nr:hypothetical protein SAMN04489710_11562 [Paracidovorax konjaci]
MADVAVVRIVSATLERLRIAANKCRRTRTSVVFQPQIHDSAHSPNFSAARLPGHPHSLNHPQGFHPRALSSGQHQRLRTRVTARRRLKHCRIAPQCPRHPAPAPRVPGASRAGRRARAHRGGRRWRAACLALGSGSPGKQAACRWSGCCTRAMPGRWPCPRTPCMRCWCRPRCGRWDSACMRCVTGPCSRGRDWTAGRGERVPGRARRGKHGPPPPAARPA